MVTVRGMVLRMGRNAEISDDMLRALARKYHKEHDGWPTVQELRAEGRCGMERAARALRAAKSVDAREPNIAKFKALAYLHGYRDLAEVYDELERLMMRDVNVSSTRTNLTRNELRAKVALLHPDLDTGDMTKAQLIPYAWGGGALRFMEALTDMGVS